MSISLGTFLGWLLVSTITGSILNYVVKLLAKKFGKKFRRSSTGKSILDFLIIVFVRNHKYFSFASLLILLVHFINQFSIYGLNYTGAIAATILILQMLLGLYMNKKHKRKKDPEFIIHRILACFLILAIALHIITPNIFVALLSTEQSVETPVTPEVPDIEEELTLFTIEEVADFNGKDGKKGYVIYKGLVYDVSDHPKWLKGEHNINRAGTDLTKDIDKSPHGEIKFQELEVVGKIK